MPADLLADDDVLADAAAQAAVLRRDERAEVAELAKLAIELTRESLVPVGGVEFVPVLLAEPRQLGHGGLDPGGPGRVDS